MEMPANGDRTLEAFKQLVQYLRGALWWIRNDLLKERQSAFNPEDAHKGHPALSLRLSPVESRYDAVPMLVGTSAKKLPSYSKAQCVAVRGLTAEEPDHLAYFGAIVEPGLYGVVELLDGVEKKNDIVKVRLDGDE